MKMKVFGSFPLLSIPVALYNVFSMSTGDGAIRPVQLNSLLFRISMPAGENVLWTITWGDFLLTLSLAFLFWELVRSVMPGRTAILNHALSMGLFILCMVEFLLFSRFATSVFFLITLMTLLDVLAGFIVTIGASRRDISLAKD
ncbi:MAG TPA: hypothetical protein VEY30_10345 [Myxococcaceae bacterium]|nr:hypothetical protein [Myxococcaceae bacterium]